MLDLGVLVRAAVGGLVAGGVLLALRGLGGLVRRAVRGLAGRRRALGRRGGRVLREAEVESARALATINAETFMGHLLTEVFSVSPIGKISRTAAGEFPQKVFDKPLRWPGTAGAPANFREARVNASRHARAASPQAKMNEDDWSEREDLNLRPPVPQIDPEDSAGDDQDRLKYADRRPEISAIPPIDPQSYGARPTVGEAGGAIR